MKTTKPIREHVRRFVATVTKHPDYGPDHPIYPYVLRLSSWQKRAEADEVEAIAEMAEQKMNGGAK